MFDLFGFSDLSVVIDVVVLGVDFWDDLLEVANSIGGTGQLRNEC